MGLNYWYLLNTVSAVGMLAIHITHDNVPWYMTATLFLNIAILAILSLIHDWKESNAEDKIKALEKELDELRQKINE